MGGNVGVVLDAFFGSVHILLFVRVAVNSICLRRIVDQQDAELFELGATDAYCLGRALGTRGVASPMADTAADAARGTFLQVGKGLARSQVEATAAFATSVPRPLPPLLAGPFDEPLDLPPPMVPLGAED